MTAMTEAPAPTRRTAAGKVQPPKPVKQRRRPGRLALAIALVALGTLGVVWYVGQVSKTTSVVSVAADVHRGEQLTAEDLAVAELPDGPSTLATVPAAQLNELVGQYANADLTSGMLLTPTAVTPELTPPAGESIVGVALTPAQMPTQQLSAGDKVQIVETPVSQGEPPAEAPGSIEATVVSASLTPSGDQTIVDVQVAQEEAGALAARAASGRVALVLDSVGE